MESRLSALGGIRILLADDSCDNQKLFQRILSQAGAQVDLADNGAMAVELWAANEHNGEGIYDVVVMDIRMPILDGYGAASEIRRCGFNGPIIALTAHATPGEEDRCRSAGCSHFYPKPIDRKTLITAVETSLGALLALPGPAAAAE